jgi:hypothetical protein
VQDFMQKNGLLFFKRRVTQNPFQRRTLVKVSEAQYHAIRSYIAAIIDVAEHERIRIHL